jgi:hypothetical protein
MHNVEKGGEMRTFLFFAVLFAMFIFTIVVAYKPSMIGKEYNKIKAPIEKHFAEQRDEIWRAAKDKEWQAWKKQIRLPADCAKPRSSLREMECKNRWQQQADTFERNWNNKVANGWKPEGVD